MQRFVLTMDLQNDPQLIAKYEEAHRNVWPEITQGIRSVGIERMDIYRLGTRMVMIMEMPEGLNREEAMKRLATLPRQAEWEEYVAQFQNCTKEATSADKWHDMAQIFKL